jgi:hypothetical protein
MKLLREIRNYLQLWGRECRAAHQYGTALEIKVLDDIAAEAVADEKKLAAQAHRARVNDDEAGQLLDAVLADGRVTPGEITTLKKARRHVAASAQADHDLAEGLTA